MMPRFDRTARARAWHPAGRRGVMVAAFFLSLTLMAEPPQWLEEAARVAPLPESTTATAEVLRDEVIITIDPQGEWTEIHRYVVRVCAAGGEGKAHMGVDYIEKFDKIILVNAWLMKPGKKRTVSYARSQWLDFAAMNRTMLYTDFRKITHSAGAAQVGDVYGGEIVVQRGQKEGQQHLTFGGENYVRRARIELRLPAGWKPDLFWLRGEAPTPTVSADGRIWAWELNDVPVVQPEPWAPRPNVPYYVAIKMRMPAEAPEVIPRLDTWQDFARWSENLFRPQCDTSPLLQEKVQKLTAGLADPWAKLQALSQYAQKQTYIQQYENTGLGFGYRPRKASEVCASGYGDCKDKANFFQALLREAGFKGHVALVSYGSGREVRPEWVGQQFNHAINAIELPPGVDHPAAITHPVFGRILFFDPTNPWVPLGQLPWLEHGGRALICDARETSLTTMPTFTPEQAWSTHTQVELGFIERGLVEGVLQEVTAGEPAALARARAKEDTLTQKRKFWSDRLVKATRGVRVGDPVEKELSDGRYQNDLSFFAREFGQMVQDKMLIVRLDVLSRDTIPVFPRGKRLLPMVVRPVHETQEVKLRLPDRGVVTELPAAKAVRSEFGEYTGSYTIEDRNLVYRRKLTLYAATIRAKAYPALSSFLTEVAKAEATSVVITLKRATAAASAPAPVPVASTP